MPILLLLGACFVVIGLMPIVFGFEPLPSTFVIAAVTVVAGAAPPIAGTRMAKRIAPTWQMTALSIGVCALLSALFWGNEARLLTRDLSGRLFALCRAGLEERRTIADAETGLRFFPRLSAIPGDPLTSAFSANCLSHSLEFVSPATSK